MSFRHQPYQIFSQKLLVMVEGMVLRELLLAVCLYKRLLSRVPKKSYFLKKNDVSSNIFDTFIFIQQFMVLWKVEFYWEILNLHIINHIIKIELKHLKL